MSQDFHTWFTHAMTKIADSLGLYINGYELTRVVDSNRFVSDVFRVRMQLYNNTYGRNEELALVLKRPVPVEQIRQLQYTDIQFYNEAVFYQMYSEPKGNFPRCFFFELRPPVDSVIALEDVTARGYRVCPYTYDAPLDYTLAAMREIARFHGKGYAMRELQTNMFFDIVERFVETRYYETAPDDHLCKYIISKTSTRAVEYLRSRGYDAAFCDRAEALLSNAYEKVMLKAIRNVETLSTLCHGDFTLSNMLFKTGDDGQHQAMLIDFALMRYATPVIDLSTYLSLCCSNEIRRENFTEILKTYHDALKEYLLEAGVQDIDKYSYYALLNDYRRGGLFGFVIASFFLPMLRGGLEYDVEKPPDLEEIGKLARQSGGEEMSAILAGILLHLYDLGCSDL